MHPRILTADDLNRALPMAEAIETSREAFAALSTGSIVAPIRTSMVEGNSTTLLMGASCRGVGRIAKVVNVFPDNGARNLPTTSGVLMLLDPETGHTLGICDGGALTAIRTGAVGGLATDLLARRDSQIGAVLGAGSQARTQLLAMTTVRSFREIRIYSPRLEKVTAMIKELEGTITTRLVAAASSPEAVEDADVITAATSSNTPVFNGDHVSKGAHINGVGSYRLDMHELDERIIDRSNRIVVDLRESAMHEAGELVAASISGKTKSEAWLELSSVLNDPSTGRQNSDDITLFKSVGHAAQDLFAARRAIDNAERLDLGRRIKL